MDISDSDADVQYRLMRQSEAERVCRLIDVVFDKYVAPEYLPEWIVDFRKYNTVEGMLARLKKEHFVVVALQKGEIIGAIEIRENRHISLFFVEEKFQGKGVGRNLWSNALKHCPINEGFVLQFTVNSSPYAVLIYQKLGFKKITSEQICNGIRLIPMVYYLKDSAKGEK